MIKATFDYDEAVFLLELVDWYRAERLAEELPRDSGADETSAKLAGLIALANEDEAWSSF